MPAASADSAEFAAGPDPQSGVGAEEHPPDGEDEDEAGIVDKAQRGEYPPDAGQVGEARHGNGRDLRNARGQTVDFPDDGNEGRRQPGADQVDRRGGHDLIAAQRHRHQGERAARKQTGEERADEADPGIAGEIGDHHGRKGADQHHAFEPDVHHPAAFADQTAEHGHQDRQGQAQGADDQRNRQQVAHDCISGLAAATVAGSDSG